MALEAAAAAEKATSEKAAGGVGKSFESKSGHWRSSFRKCR